MSDLKIIDVKIFNTSRSSAEVIAALEAIGCSMISTKETPAMPEDLSAYGMTEMTDGVA